MPRVTYINPDQTREDLDVEVGTSVMQAATAHGIDGIVAECGGEAMCATCHVYLADEDLPRAPDTNEEENEMLEFTASPRTANSRLSCQLVMTPQLDGITVYVPEDQT